jgi:murein DD-endopeptidase MepM/ murein hydrolase activator NlpD
MANQKKSHRLWSRTTVGAWAFALLALLALTGSLRGEEKLVSITNKKIDGATRFFVENLQTADITVTIEAKLSNYASATPLPCTVSVPPRAKVEAFAIRPVEQDVDSKWSYTYFATWGNLEARHEEEHVYQLPFAPGESFPVSQGFHGAYSHTGGDAYAIDFKMPEGSQVHAARDGVVEASRDESRNGGPDKKYEWDANYILVKHSDGTYAHYVHLQAGGNRVKVGDRVKAGDWIGLSGNTGHTTGPHLHFAVFKAASGKTRETFPVKFNAGGTMAQTLKEGSTYKSM